MSICKVLVPAGALGTGINPEAFENGLNMKPDVIAADAGSTDSGPGYLANGMGKYAREMIKSDMKIAVLAGKALGIPVFVGSCGTCGTDNMVDYWAEIGEEIYKEEGIKARIAKVYSEQSPETLVRKWNEGKIKPLEGAPRASEETFGKCSHIVALMGAEPFIKAYKEGADLVLCGRATDTAILAALPLHMGCNEAAAWHGAKTAECGAQCTDNSEAKGVLLTVDDKGFLITPLLPQCNATPYTVAAHMVYENVDPTSLTEPSGTVYTENSVYTQLPNGQVYVTNSRFDHAPKYTMKLEGAAAVGFQSISLVGIADPDVLNDPESWIKNISEYVTAYIEKSGICKEDYSFRFKAYGYNAVVNRSVLDNPPPPLEIGMLLTVTAKTQEMATKIAKIFNPYLLHFPADPKKMLPSFAFPFSPVDIPRGATYEFMLHHVVEVLDPLELVRFEYLDLE